MIPSLYIVKKGDTLSQIAKIYSTTPGKLADLNNLESQNYIRIGQTLRLPTVEAGFPQLTLDPKELFFEENKKMWVEFMDANEQYIAGLKVWISLNGKETEHITNSSGRIQVDKKDEVTNVKVSVIKTNGDKKQISEFEAHLIDQTYVTHISPKVEYLTNLRLHEIENSPPNTSGTITKNKSKPDIISQPVKTTKNRSDKNHPVDSVESFTSSPENNLKLRKKDWERYSNIILEASRKKKLKPYFIAAILNAEAATVNGCWSPGSANTGSSARGLTQFLGGTWLLYAKKHGSYINVKASEKGWIKGKKTTNKLGVAKVKYTVVNKLEVLNMRYDPECSIYTGIEYAVDNLNTLKSTGYPIDKLGEGDQAKIAYLAHHLGSQGAIDFIQHNIDEPTAKYLLGKQFGNDPKRVEQNLVYFYKLGGNSYIKGHRLFIRNTIEYRVKIKNFMCDTSKLTADHDLLELTDLIKQ